MKTSKKFTAIAAAAAASLALGVAPAQAQTEPAGSIDTASIVENPIANGAVLSVGVPLALASIVLCETSVDLGNSPAGSCS